MLEQEKNELAGLLMNYNFQDLKKAEQTATNDKDFDKLREIYKIQDAIDIILKAIDKDCE